MDERCRRRRHTQTARQHGIGEENNLGTLVESAMKSARNLGTHLASRSTAPTVNKRDLVSVTGRCCGIDLRPTGASSVGSVSAGCLAGWLAVSLSVGLLSVPESAINQSTSQSAVRGRNWGAHAL